ncbi:TIGR02270 family protein [Archangium violaceum]|uniref:TIGR02270 family protein n=1 Tax=Archangium violaceum TaxID=83451 RepID=UPI00193BC333|nr:TIGR02270 family protein [Archangium violaceum]QRK04193.1 TIGR02270 family protein [Archangium violaceum]
MSDRSDPLLNWDIQEEHLDEAAFFWGQWERSLSAPDEVLPDVAVGEERLLARLDALVLGGPRVAERLLMPALASDEPERLSSAAFTLLFDASSRRGSDAVLSALRDAAPDACAAILRALEVLPTASLPAWVESLLAQPEPSLQALALDVLGAHSLSPGLELTGFLSEEDPRLSAAALRASVRLRARLDRKVLQRFWSSSESSVRDAAILAGLIQGQREAWMSCRQVVEARGPDLELPLLLLALGGDAGELAPLRGLLDVTALRPHVLWALGFSGRVSAAEACLAYLGDEAVGHLAAEAFCSITGLELSGRFLAGDPFLEDEEPGSEAPLGSHPMPGPGLPLLDARLVRDWWVESRTRFNPETRYLRGRPWSPAVLLQGLWTEPMRRRHGLALEVALRSQGTFQARTRRFARHQLAVLETLRTTPPSLSSGPFVRGLAS